jgi:hypothetical protein
MIERFDESAGRAAAAGFDHGRNRTFRADEDRLHRAVAAIAHPASKTM